MIHALLLSALLSQTIYEWVDSKGESHFTDDVSTIPAGAKRRVTEGAPFIVEPGDAGPGKKATAPLPVVTPKAGPDTCARARDRVRSLEQQLAQVKAAQENAANAPNPCQRALNVGGQPAYARCMASRPNGAPTAPSTSGLEKDLDAAREALRKAQVEGCR